MSGTSPRQYKRYLEPTCDPNHTTDIPRRTKYRNTRRSCTAASGKNEETVSAKSGEGINYVTYDEDIGILTEIEAHLKTSVKDAKSSSNCKEVVSNAEDDVEDAKSCNCEEVVSNAEDCVEDTSMINEVEKQEEEDILITENADEQEKTTFTDESFQQEDLHEKQEIKISICKKDILTLILAFALKYQVSDTGILSLIELINIILGQNFINPSLYHLWKTFNCNINNNIKTHYFCDKCKTYLCNSNENRTINCNNCDTKIDTNIQKSSCFLSISLKSQIENMFRSGIISLPYVQECNEGKTTKVQNEFADTYDGNMYKKLRNENQPLFLTYNFSVDGLSVYNNAKGTLWPILVTINEIPATIRFQNVLLAGIWFGKKEPKMDVYLKPFVEEAINLAEVGISLPDCKFNLKVFAACCCADSVARPCIQNTVQYNGYYGCSWCQHPGFLVNSTVKYPYKDNLLYAERTGKKTIKLMYEAMRAEKSILGIKGPCILLPIPFFNVISNFVPDYMHGIFLGVIKYLVTAWFDSRYKSKDFYLGLVNLNLINDRMKKVVFPRNVGRVPRSILDKNLYKAVEWKNFLLYIILPCLKGILKQCYFEHISLLVGAVNILMKKSVSVVNLKIADDLLLKFVTETQLLYGEEFMTFNMHLLLHFTTSVTNWGPLWSHSMFVYEGYNAILQTFIMGTCGIKTQAVKRFLLQQDLINNKNSYPVNISDFIAKINSKHKFHKKFIQIDNCVLYGAPQMHIKDVCCLNIHTGFLLKNDLLANDDIQYFKRMTINNMLFTVQSNKQYRTCDCLIYTETEIGKIIFIIFHRSISKVEVCMNTYEVVTKPNKNVDMYSVKKSDTFIIIDASKIIGKCTEYYDNSGLIFICKVPVTSEMCT